MIGQTALGLYLGLSRLATPFAPRLLQRRLARGKEDPERIDERLGRAARARPPGAVIWLHGASVGEGLTMLPLIEAIRARAPATSILVTTGTVTSAQRLSTLLPEGSVHQFVPVDTRGAVCGFLDHWKPDLAIWIESELWPRLIVETRRRKTPMALVNARVSAASARNWAWLRGMARRLLDGFEVIVTQDDETADRLVSLGVAAERISPGGNLKVAIAPPGCDEAALKLARAALGDRPVWLAASTHPGEEWIVADAHIEVRQSLPDLLTVIAPRHPERGDEIAALLREKGLSVARRSAGDLPDGRTEVWLADTLGEMGLWYRLAPVAFVGGSIARVGGHNPFEPAALGCAILHGPDTTNFAPSYRALDAAEATIRVTGAEDLARAIAALLDHAGGAGLRTRMTESAARVRREACPDVDALAARLLALLPGAAERSA